MAKPRFELWETDHGVDGYDAKRTLVAKFTDETKAIDWLKARGYTHKDACGYRHQDEKMRHRMGEITYDIKDLRSPKPKKPKPVVIPVDPE